MSLTQTSPRYRALIKYSNSSNCDKVYIERYGYGYWDSLTTIRVDEFAEMLRALQSFAMQKGKVIA